MQSSTPPSEFERLQGLLLGDELQALEKLSQRIDNPEQRTRDVAEVLSDAIRLSAQDRVLETVLREPIERAIHESIRRDPKEIANLLYPIILPAVRRSIEESLRAFAERIDLLVAQRLSVNSLKWRFEAWRTGATFTEVMLRNSLRYRVEHLLLIQEGSGLLMKHAHAKDATMADTDAVSAMLSAIESFVRDSFTHDAGEQLNRVTFGNQIIHLAHGPHAMLASVVRGTAPPDYLIRLKELIEDIHNTSPTALREYRGDPRVLDGITPLLDSSFEREFISRKKIKKKEKQSGRTNRLALFGIVAATLVTTFVGYRMYINSQISQLVSALREEPGVVVTDVRRQGNAWLVRGLKSSTSGPLEDVVSSSGIDSKTVTLDFSAYASFGQQSDITSEFDKHGGIPSTAKLSPISVPYTLEGSVPVEWLLAIKKDSAAVRSLAQEKLKVDAAEVAEFLKQSLRLPKSVGIAADDDIVVLTGKIAPAQTPALHQLITQLAAHVMIDVEKLEGYDD